MSSTTRMYHCNILDVLDISQLLFNTRYSVIHYLKSGITLPSFLKEGHLLFQMPITAAHFSQGEVKKLNFHFFHPYASFLFILQASSAPPTHSLDSTFHLFPVSELPRLPKFCFCSDLLLRIPPPSTTGIKSWISRSPAIHRASSHPPLYVVLHITLQTASVLHGRSAANTWNILLNGWASFFFVSRNKIKVGHRSGNTNDISSL